MTTTTVHQPTPDPAPSRTKRRRRWPWITAAALLALTVAGVAALRGLRARGLAGVQIVISDHHLGLKAAIAFLLQPDPADGPPVSGVTHVEMHGDAFDPPRIQVAEGQTVTWHFTDGDTEHNVAFNDFASPNQSTGTFEHTFDAPGSHRYRCTLHLQMNGRVDVVAATR